MAASQHPRLCFIICVLTLLLLILFSQALTDRRQEERHERDILDTTDIPAEHIDPAAIDLTPLVNTLINTSQSGSRQLFSLLSVTSYSSLALHKLTLLVYNISNIRSLESNKFRRRFCYCVTNETNDLTDFTAILLDVMGNSTSYLHELFKSASILSVSQRNNSDCIYICVMAGKMGREMPELWEVGSITPLFNQTIVEGPHRVGNVSSFRLPVEWHQLPTNLSHISPSGMSSSLTSRVHSTAHVSPTTMDETAALTARITTAQPLATARQHVTTIPQSQTTADRLETTTRGTTQRTTVQEVTTRAVTTARTTATEVPTILQPVTSTQPATTLQVTTASVTTAAAPTTVRAPSTTTRAPSTTTRVPSTPLRALSTPASAPSTPIRTPLTTVRTPLTTVRAPSTTTRASSTPVRALSTPVRTLSTTVRAPPTTVRPPSIPVTARLTTVRAPSATVTARSTMVTAQTTPVRPPSTTTTLTMASTKLTTFLPVISQTRLTTATHQPSTTTQHSTSTGHTTRLSPARPTAGFTVSRRTTGLLSRRTTTPSKSLETEKPGCPWRRPELTDFSLSGSTTTVSAQKLQPCVLELCKFFSQCLCRPFSHKTRMKRYCDDSHVWYEKHTHEVCRRVRRVSFSRNLKQRCLTKMCNKL